MRNLISAIFARLFKGKLFWVTMIVALGFAALATGMRVYESNVLLEPGYDTPDGLLFLGALYLVVIVAVFDALFIGNEHADGGFRNQLAVGYTKIQVYMAYLIVSGVAVLLIHLAYIAVVLGIAVPFLSPFQVPASVNVVLFFCSLFAAVALNSLMVWLCMLISNKATVVAACMLLAIALLVGGMAVHTMLSEPEFYRMSGVTTVDGVILSTPQTYPNPDYLTGTKRTVIQFFQDFWPSGQMVTISTAKELPAHVWCLPVYSVVFTVLVTLGGAVIFRRRDLK